MWDAGLWFRTLAIVQSAIYGAGLTGFALSATRVGRWRLLSIPYYFVLSNLAALVALRNVLAGRKIERWESHRMDVEAVQWRQTTIASSP